VGRMSSSSSPVLFVPPSKNTTRTRIYHRHATSSPTATVRPRRDLRPPTPATPPAPTARRVSIGYPRSEPNEEKKNKNLAGNY
jgi:hypothetical protein